MENKIYEEFFISVEKELCHYLGRVLSSSKTQKMGTALSLLVIFWIEDFYNFLTKSSNFAVRLSSDVSWCSMKIGAFKKRY